MKRILQTLAVTALLVAIPASAHAFCGFYVGGGTSDLYNNATQVVLMRDGTRTILSMQNNYEGPLEAFAMVVPVPVVLQEQDVKTLPKAVFDKIDQLTAPRLVEYWEQDPCAPDKQEPEWGSQDAGASDQDASDPSENNGGGVVVEAEFKVGEYQIVILSADDSGALTAWLGANDYNLPEGAGPHLQPYIDAGQFFFVAKVIEDEVAYADGRALLSPLRFHYDSPRFTLPIRLGLISAEDQQDLIVYTLALGSRFEVANYPNVTIPTNINVRDEVRNDFGGFYNTLFARTQAHTPGAVVTEYAWNSSTCDPCPGPVLEPADLATLGADVHSDPAAHSRRDWVVTRLHARYAAGDVGEDLVLALAGPIAGGREFLNEEGVAEVGAAPAGINNFQGRYAIRHAWEGPVDCPFPRYGVWGARPDQAGGQALLDGAVSPNSSGDDYRTQGAALETLVAQDVPEIGVEAGDVPNNNAGGNNGGVGNGGDGSGGGSSGGCSATGTATALPLVVLVVVLGFWVVRRRG